MTTATEMTRPNTTLRMMWLRVPKRRGADSLGRADWNEACCPLLVGYGIAGGVTPACC